MNPIQRYSYSEPCLKRAAEFQTIEDIRRKQREGKILNFYEKQRIQREDEANRKRNISRKKK